MAIDPAKPFDLTYRVDGAFDGLRVDRFVQAMVPTISRTRIQAYNREGRILVNDERRAQNWRVREGDVVTLRCPVPPGGASLGRDIPVDVMWEDGYLLAVNKQPGLVVHPVALHRHDTLMNALYWRYRDRLGPGNELSLVNHIDKLTSGLVLVSKDPEAKRDLQRQFEARSVDKGYLGLALGEMEADAGTIDRPVGPRKGTQNRVLQDVREDGEGRPSQSAFRVLERLCAPVRPADGGPARRERFTLVRLVPRTGRQHQLRVHLAYLGHPLVGDHLYGDNHGLRATGPDGGEVEIARFALHAHWLAFDHPVTGKRMEVTAPPSADLAGVLDALRAGQPLARFALESFRKTSGPHAPAPEVRGRSEAGEDTMRGRC